MSELAEGIQEKMMLILKEEEDNTDLDNLAVLSRVGLKVATATSAEVDADEISASSTALIDLGLRLSEATFHGALKEIILHNNAGYTILMAIDDNYMMFGGLSAVFRIGYYLGYLRELVKKLNILISGGEISEMTLSLKEEELKKIRKEQDLAEEQAAKVVVPSVEQDRAAMDELLGFLDEWDKEEKEAMGVEDADDLESGNVVSIPESITVGLPKVGEEVRIVEQSFQEIEQEDKSGFKLYKDEVPPVPLDDYTPMDVDEEPPAAQEYVEDFDLETTTPSINHDHSVYQYEALEESPPEELPAFEELPTPDFGSESVASEYDTEFILEEESEALDSVLKELGWEEED